MNTNKLVDEIDILELKGQDFAGSESAEQKEQRDADISISRKGTEEAIYLGYLQRLDKGAWNFDSELKTVPPSRSPQPQEVIPTGACVIRRRAVHPDADGHLFGVAVAIVEVKNT
jgi:hypothetical protein